ncbi:MAG: MFS transporter, partial [Myxococcales bacterium]|nr:MFS transporter [Myxococcales bacterium]
MTAAPPDSFSAMRIPFVRWFALGRITGALGVQMLSVTVGWQLYERTGSAWSLGLVGVCQFTPVVLLMLPAGNVADRFPRRHIAMLTHVAFGGIALGLAWVAHTNAPTPWIYALLVVAGISRAFASPSIATLMPQLLAPAQFQNANAWLSSSYELASMAGPAAGGFLIAATGNATASYVATALGQLVSVGTLFALPLVRPKDSAGTTKRTPGDLFAGFTFIRRNRIYLAAITLDLLAVLVGGCVALLPVFAKDILGVGPSGLGTLRSAIAVGAFSMAIVSTRLPPWKRPGHALLYSVAGFGLATIVFGLSRNFALSLACLFLVGAFDMVSVVIRKTLEQVLTPDHLRGRVSAVNAVFVGTSNEIGAFESGLAATL